MTVVNTETTEMEMKPLAVEVRGLTKTYPGDVQAVRGIDFDVFPGEVFGLLGPNGAGKSTTVGMLTGTVAPTGGTARLAGWDVVAVPEARVRHAHGASTNPGSELFHLWNERNRLLTLLRCAPAGVAVRQLIKFAVLTALLPLRPGKPDAANFRVRLRVRVLTQVAARLPAALAARRRITRFGTLSRGAVWDAWAGL